MGDAARGISLMNADSSRKRLKKVFDVPIKNENVLLAVGAFSLSLSILIGFFHVEISGFSVTDFAEGVLMGISLVLNLTFLIRRRAQKRLLST